MIWGRLQIPAGMSKNIAWENIWDGRVGEHRIKGRSREILDKRFPACNQKNDRSFVQDLYVMLTPGCRAA